MDTLTPELKRKNRRLTLILVGLAAISMIFGAIFLMHYGFPTERVTIH